MRLAYRPSVCLTSLFASLSASLLHKPSLTSGAMLLSVMQSKSSPLGAVVKFAAGGKTRPKKEMGLMTMQGYPDVYVASVCLESNYNQVGACCLGAWDS